MRYGRRARFVACQSSSLMPTRPCKRMLSNASLILVSTLRTRSLTSERDGTYRSSPYYPTIISTLKQPRRRSLVPSHAHPTSASRSWPTALFSPSLAFYMPHPYRLVPPLSVPLLSWRSS